jgi:hypothetical protein
MIRFNDFNPLARRAMAILYHHNTTRDEVSKHTLQRSGHETGSLARTNNKNPAARLEREASLPEPHRLALDAHRPLNQPVRLHRLNGGIEQVANDVSGIHHCGKDVS